ncbi:hypothetical protein BU26DRAFT_500060 [Trematosphaeria pertusa]|uniref:Uncharacterized protein n=1 Tax=Trematosphaeria pertusa TaxID=390896 RepID=A0A6A6IVK3_9PLEO|nr:uncharacterized protein BU26DRAFT_500060 [Trematosphaeria pertusa]KAF2254278.1 hypothetical protein BU26DRAFT_500060 [Trematosphaeria pertusa]
MPQYEDSNANGLTGRQPCPYIYTYANTGRNKGKSKLVASWREPSALHESAKRDGYNSTATTTSETASRSSATKRQPSSGGYANKGGPVLTSLTSSIRISDKFSQKHRNPPASAPLILPLPNSTAPSPHRMVRTYHCHGPPGPALIYILRQTASCHAGSGPRRRDKAFLPKHVRGYVSRGSLVTPVIYIFCSLY